MGGKNLECDVVELYKWIDNHPISRQKRNINRDFSDAVPLAEILKRHYPKLVQLHNYTPSNSVSQKLVNWQTLNKKVLKKLNIALSNTVMKQLSESVPGVIEKVLFDVREKVELKDTDDKSVEEEKFFMEGLSATISGSIIPIKQKDSSKTLDHKIVPVDIYTKMESELSEKDEAIAILKNKLQHLENLLAIKDERINDLTRQISNKSGMTISSTKFFNKLF